MTLGCQFHFSSSFVNITFEVNMQNEATNSQGVFVGGGSLAGAAFASKDITAPFDDTSM